MHYSSSRKASAATAKVSVAHPLLEKLGDAVRAARKDKGVTRRTLAERAHVSERFLAELESGSGNISVLRLADVAAALGTSGAELLQIAERAPRPPMGVIALLGVRGAGKSTVGQAAAHRLGVPFVELDALVAQEAGMSLATLFEIHGEAHFRRVERDALARFLDRGEPAVMATSGSIVNDEKTFALLRARTKTVWLKARAKDHWDRVVAQGDGRPMRGRANAKSELEELLRARKPLYERADAVIDTSLRDLDETVTAVLTFAKR